MTWKGCITCSSFFHAWKNVKDLKNIKKPVLDIRTMKKYFQKVCIHFRLHIWFHLFSRFKLETLQSDTTFRYEITTLLIKPNYFLSIECFEPDADALVLVCELNGISIVVRINYTRSTAIVILGTTSRGFIRIEARDLCDLRAKCKKVCHNFEEFDFLRIHQCGC